MPVYMTSSQILPCNCPYLAGTQIFICMAIKIRKKFQENNLKLIDMGRSLHMSNNI